MSPLLVNSFRNLFRCRSVNRHKGFSREEVCE
nr:MAG TPA: hypothetical protein [Caudoviricetes sp.]